MPMKINVGLSRKVGQPNYGSCGGSVHFEAEVEATLVREPEALHKRVRYLFRLAEDALSEQLSAGTDNIDASGGNGQLPRPPVTARQLALIQRLAEQSECDIEAKHLPGAPAALAAQGAIAEMLAEAGDADPRHPCSATDIPAGL